MNYKPLGLALTFLALVWAFYFWQFHHGFSPDQGDWGTFGDFTGGVLNPLLNFITIYLLITQFKEVKSDLSQQRADDAIKAFESSFFTFTTIALNEFKTFEISQGNKIYKGSAAIGYIENFYDAAAESNQDVYKALNDLDQSCHDAIFSLTSSFCVVFKLIEDSCPAAAKEKYLSLFSMLLPTKVTYLLCMTEAATKWMMLTHPRRLGYFDKTSVKKVLDHYRDLAENKHQAD